MTRLLTILERMTQKPRKGERKERKRKKKENAVL